MVKLGIDFDNTLINYDNVFYQLALEKNLIEENFPQSKLQIRDYLRSKGKNDEFTELQGEAYGPKILLAKPYEGMTNALMKLKREGIDIVIISHKTKYPYKGPKYNLREYALNWLEEIGFFLEDFLSFNKDDIHFESTKEFKAAKIKELGCTHFIDDLPEILNLLPDNISKILFNSELYSQSTKYKVLTHWDNLLDFILK